MNSHSANSAHDYCLDVKGQVSTVWIRVVIHYTGPGAQFDFQRSACEVI